MAIKPKDLIALVRKQDYRCALTGDLLTPENAAPDHKVAMANGGTNEIDNLQIVTLQINRMKSSLSTEEFVSLCERVVAHSRGKRTSGEKGSDCAAPRRRSGELAEPSLDQRLEPAPSRAAPESTRLSATA